MTNTSPLSRQLGQSMLEAKARPAPMQRRSVERVQALLRAAEELLVEQGYEAATLKAIGERAGIPTASVYHYFADRHQVDTELLRRHLDEMEQRVTVALEKSEARTLREVVDVVIDTMLAYYREHPSSVELWFARRTSPLSELARAYDTTQAEKLLRLLIERNLIRADTSPLVLKIAFEAGDRLFDIAFRHSPTGDDTVIDEARRLVTAYLETYTPLAP